MTIGILLAGGNSTRFKEDKALYLDSRFQMTWGQLQVEKLLKLTQKVYVVANPKNHQKLTSILAMYKNVEIILDDPFYFNEGPLSGIYTVAKRNQNEDFLVLGIDYPDVGGPDLGKLLQKKNVYALDGSLHPHYTLCHLTFHYQSLKEFMATGNRRLRGFLEKCQASGMQITNETLKNYNRLENE